MGMFSGHCKGCGAAVNEGEDSALVQIDTYSGYGMSEHEVHHYWHRLCYEKILNASGISMEHSMDDDSQGMSPIDERHRDNG